MASTSKETPGPVKEKKRRRTLKTDHKGESRSSSPDSSGKKSRTTGESDKSRQNNKYWFNAEENQVDKRDPQTDLALHKAACDELRKVMSEIQQLKDSDDDNKEEKIEELRIHGTLQFIGLRKLNRLAHFRCKKVSNVTNEAKILIDTQQLKLQNLLYEVMHLQKEITKCLQFKSTDEDIDLVEVEEFYQDAPENISKPSITQKDNHQQTLARLDWELEQRKRLAVKLKDLQSNKDVIAQEIQTKKDYLDNLHPKLNDILQVTKPVQEYLEMPFDEIREQQTTAAYLPRPLYVLYMQATAYHDACDKYLSVAIQGDVDMARAMTGSTVELEEESDSDNEDQDKPKKKKVPTATLR